jgi:pimeloyl-ACP methyl ester carboxylesterase
MATDGESRPRWVPTDLYPFASHFEDVNGSRVHYLDEGVGPPLILLHGNPTWSFLYRDLIAGLRDRYRCIDRGPFPTPQSRRPVHVFPREILTSRAFLADIESKLAVLGDRPALVVWGTKDFAFRAAERRRWEEVFRHHRTVLLDGAGHYIQEDAAQDIVAAIRDWQS